MRITLFLFLLVAVSSVSAFAQEDIADTTVVILVRHAEKESGQDPSLNAAGQSRALALRDSLLAYDIDVLVASQFKRTAETLEPLATTLGLTVIVRPLESSAAAASARSVALQLVEEFAGRTIVVAGHSNTVPAMVSALAGRPMSELDERDYDNLFIVRFAPGGEPGFLHLRYGEPDGVE
ncbi:MAG: phosphoglycerate mutase family protein [Rubricoccaceae bacterium]|nr:phosphoglycerate mutase family protein [Rubricoccaceae bacterium]